MVTDASGFKKRDVEEEKKKHEQEWILRMYGRDFWFLVINYFQLLFFYKVGSNLYMHDIIPTFKMSLCMALLLSTTIILYLDLSIFFVPNHTFSNF